MLRPKRTRVTTIDLNDRRFENVPEGDKAWLNEKLGEKPRFDDITSMLQRTDLSTSERSILVALRKSLVGDMRAESGRAFTSDGSKSLTEVRARTLRAAQAPSGTTDLQQRITEELPNSMLGHEDQTDSFVEFARRYESPARQNMPLMAVVGQEGQGKAEAIDAFKTLVLGEEAEVVTIDFRDFGGTGGTAAAALFGKDGLLSPESLQTRVPGYTPPPKADPDDDDPPEAKPGLIVLKGVEGLQANNQDMADGLARLLSTKRSTPEFANVMVVLDFEKPATEDPRKLVIDAIGAVGNRNLGATAVFGDLGGEELMSYAEPLLKSSLAMPGIGDVVVEMDADAEAALKQALATPHTPLDEMEQRLYEFIISKFDTQTNVNREDAVLRVSLDPQWARNPAALERLIGKLHEPYADLRLGNQLFVVNIVARQVESTADLGIALRHGKKLGELLLERSAQLAIGMPVVAPEVEDVGAQVLGAMSRLGDAVTTAIQTASKNHELTREELLSPMAGGELDDQIETLRLALTALDSDEGAKLPAAWRVTVRQLAVQYADAAHLISDTLQGIAPPPEPEPEPAAEEAPAE